MARVKISELPELTSGSLNTILVGDDNGSTYKIPLSVITASVVQMLSASADARLDALEAFQINIGSGSSNTSLNTFTSSYLTDSASFDERIIAATNEQDLSGYVTEIVYGVLSQSVDSRVDNIELFTQSIDSRVDSLESWSSSLDTTFATDLQVSIVSSSVAATIGIISQNTGLVTTSSFNQYTSSQTELNNTFATTGSNEFFGSQTINGFVSASYYQGSGRSLTDLTPTTNWNYDKDFSVKKTEQLTFSGDYILENTYLAINGGQTASIGEWTIDIFTNGNTGSITRNNINTFTLIGPTGDTNGSNGLQIKRLFDTETTMSISYIWSGTDVGEDRPYYDVSEYEPTEPNTASRLQNTNAVSESGNWTISVPSGSWVAIGVWTNAIDATSGSLQITLPYLPNEDISQYSSNKYFKKEGSIFIGGNLLLKDSTIENDGLISVGGEVILIGNSQIVGTGKII